MKVSLPLKALAVSALCLALGGCLVSDEPILDANTGKATPLGAGAYEMCPTSDDADEDDCEPFSISVDETGLYRFVSRDDGDDEEEVTELRFRRVARGGYAVQAEEDDGYMYYYGRGDSNRFELVMMMCASLSAKTRDRLINRGDLASDDDDHETCEVKTVRGLKAAALDYHRGRAVDADGEALVFRPISNP